MDTTLTQTSIPLFHYAICLYGLYFDSSLLRNYLWKGAWECLFLLHALKQRDSACPVNRGLPVHSLEGMRQKGHPHAQGIVSFIYNPDAKRRGHVLSCRNSDIFTEGGIKRRSLQDLYRATAWIREPSANQEGGSHNPWA
jgi:hypothetical protein